MKARDLTGRVFGHLTVLKRVDNIHGRVAWLCQCDCGNQKAVTSKKLLSGDTISCGHVRFDRSHTMAPGYEAKRVDDVATFLLDEKRKIRSDNTTGVTGVKIITYRSGKKAYQADITIKGKRYYLGRYQNIDDAKKARKEAEKRLLPKKG